MHTELDPRKTILRINRDIRFSNDKSPYKSHFFTGISEGDKKVMTAGYFFSLDPEASFYGAGIYRPDNKLLKTIREEIDYAPEEWLGVVNHSDLQLAFGEIQSTETLSRPPKGFDKEHPQLEWIKRKDFYVKKELSYEALLSEDLITTVIQDLKTVRPLVQFLNRVQQL